MFQWQPGIIPDSVRLDKQRGSGVSPVVFPPTFGRPKVGPPEAKQPGRAEKGDSEDLASDKLSPPPGSGGSRIGPAGTAPAANFSPHRFTSLKF